MAAVTVSARPPSRFPPGSLQHRGDLEPEAAGLSASRATAGTSQDGLRKVTIPDSTAKADLEDLMELERSGLSIVRPHLQACATSCGPLALDAATGNPNAGDGAQLSAETWAPEGSEAAQALADLLDLQACGLNVRWA